MSKNILWDVGGYDGTSDNAPYEVRTMDWAVYHKGEPYALFQKVEDAEAFLAMMEAKEPKKHACSIECVGQNCEGK